LSNTQAVAAVPETRDETPTQTLALQTGFGSAQSSLEAHAVLDVSGCVLESPASFALAHSAAAVQGL